MSTHMGSVNISLKKEAYEYLQSIKAENESFSDAVLKLKKERKMTGALLAESLAHHTPPDKTYFSEREKTLSETRKQIEKELSL